MQERFGRVVARGEQLHLQADDLRLECHGQDNDKAARLARFTALQFIRTAMEWAVEALWCLRTDDSRSDDPSWSNYRGDGTGLPRTEFDDFRHRVEGVARAQEQPEETIATIILDHVEMIIAQGEAAKAKAERILHPPAATSTPFEPVGPCGFGC